jgi:hypothetical protein
MNLGTFSHRSSGSHITRQSGLDRFRHRSGTPEKSTILDAPGSGVAFIDYDNDGWPDIYVCRCPA